MRAQSVEMHSLSGWAYLAKHLAQLKKIIKKKQLITHRELVTQLPPPPKKKKKNQTKIQGVGGGGGSFLHDTNFNLAKSGYEQSNKHSF